MRDGAGEVLTTVRPGGRLTTYEYDGVGRVLSVLYDDGTAEYFEYNGAGQLLTATNEYGQVQLERDGGGNVIKESWDGHTVTSTYNRLGQLTGLKSSLGADITYGFNELGHLEKMSGLAQAQGWHASLVNDVNGFELQRHLPGEAVLQHERDRTGKPLVQKLSRGGQVQISKQYRWGSGSRLNSIGDALAGSLTTFQYHASGDLTGSIYSSNSAAMPVQTLRTKDETGNYYETSDRADREYGPGGRLLRKGSTLYSYDDEGNLTEKRLKDGSAWTYSYYANGMLRTVLRPDGKEVSFTKNAAEADQWVSDLLEFHMTHSSTDLTKPFHQCAWQYFPIEVIALLALRVQSGHARAGATHELLAPFSPFTDAGMQVSGAFEQQLRNRITGFE